MSFHYLFNGIPDPDSKLFADFCSFCSSNKNSVLATLPWLAATIAGHEGFSTMLHFVREHSGTRMHVSLDLKRFRERVGILQFSERAHREVLVGAGSSQIVDIPSAWGVFLSLRRVAIQLAMNDGQSVREAARLYGVSERSLRQTSQR